MNIIPVLRHYTNESTSRRQVTVTYTLLDEQCKLQPVCKKTFTDTFSLTNKEIDYMVKLKKEGAIDVKDRRGGARRVKYSAADTTLIKKHIDSIPRYESHYGRSRSDKFYFSLDLNKNRIYNAFKDLHPRSTIDRRLYIQYFEKEFPNISFHKPRVDTCRTCDGLKNQIAIAKCSAESTLKRQDLVAHHDISEKARSEMKKDIMLSTIPDTESSVISIDLQQVIMLPNFTHSDMFYLRQLSVYNFGVHFHNANQSPYMCLWTEATSNRGANKIAS